MNLTHFYFITNFIYCLSIAGAFFSKKTARNYENKVYSRIIIFAVLCSFIETLIVLAEWYPSSVTQSLRLICVNLLPGLFLCYTYCFLVYTYYITRNKIADKTRHGFTIGLVALYAISLVLPVSSEIENNIIQYTTGPCITFAFLVNSVLIITMFIMVIVHRKDLKNERFIPLFFFFAAAIITTIIQIKYPFLLLTSTFQTVVTIIMYFTLENPDTKLIKELEISKAEAERANKAKTNFLSSMSHEIRTPLSAIVGFSSFIEDAPSLEDAKENAKDIVYASNTLLDIVNGILDISKIESGKFEVVNKPYNPKETFKEMAKLVNPKMKEKGLDFILEMASNIPTTLVGDEVNIKKIISNLLSNAAKFTDKGYVKYIITANNYDDYSNITITVEDSGRGMKPEELDKIFSKFDRLGEEEDDKTTGSGLGLSITKQLVDLMGGTIKAESDYNVGSKFTVTLKQGVNKEAVINEMDDNKEIDLNNKKILVVDDDIINIKIISKLLQKYNVTSIESCKNGLEAIEKAKKTTYDIIFLDDLMPKLSGIETLDGLKKIYEFNTPVVCMTANVVTGIREEYLAKGFDEYLAKPIENDELAKVLNKVINKK